VLSDWWRCYSALLRDISKLDLMKSPPATLEGARVLEYVIVDEAVRFTGRLHLYRDDMRVGEVPCLAIVDDADLGRLLLLHCDSDWNVIGGQFWTSPEATTVAEVKERAENYYSGLLAKWRSL
jgi:hypothetical protein